MFKRWREEACWRLIRRLFTYEADSDLWRLNTSADPDGRCRLTGELLKDLVGQAMEA